MVRTVLGPSSAISVVVSAQSVTMSARAVKTARPRTIGHNVRTQLLTMPLLRNCWTWRRLMAGHDDRRIELTQRLAGTGRAGTLDILIGPHAASTRAVVRTHRDPRRRFRDASGWRLPGGLGARAGTRAGCGAQRQRSGDQNPVQHKTMLDRVFRPCKDCSVPHAIPCSVTIAPRALPVHPVPRALHARANAPCAAARSRSRPVPARAAGYPRRP